MTKPNVIVRGQWSRLYNTRRWFDASRRFRSKPENVLCRICRIKGKLVLSELTDHIVPHNGNLDLFWDEDNWQALCWSCHSRKTSIGQERTVSRAMGCNSKGVPRDPNHPWNRR